MGELSRRNFMKGTAAGAAVGLGLLGTSKTAWAGANERINVCVMGINGRGRSHLENYGKIPNAQVTTICDVDSRLFKPCRESFAAKGLPEPKCEQDIRKVLEDPDVDVISIATPNHWHSLATIWACQAGKDVYVEKPMTHNVYEGRKVVEAAAKYKRIVQHGTQLRSNPGFIEGINELQNGIIGDVYMARCVCYKWRPSIGKGRPGPAPEGLDWNLWQGPAQEVPFMLNEKGEGIYVHYYWHWVWAYGNGDIGNQGVHQMDVARWFLGDPGLPRATLSIGGRLGYVDDGETPNTQVILHEYPAAPLIFEVRGLSAQFDPDEDKPGVASAEAAGALAASMDEYRGVRIGNIIECEGGAVVMPSYFDLTAYDRDGRVVRTFKGQDRLMRNFIDAVRSRRTGELYGPIEEGHLSSALCHLGSISHALGRAMPVAQVGAGLQQDAALAESYDRMAQHLSANRLMPDVTRVTLGARLTLAPGEERFTGAHAAAANALLARAYRAPYVVPQLA